MWLQDELWKYREAGRKLEQLKKFFTGVCVHSADQLPYKYLRMWTSYKLLYASDMAIRGTVYEQPCGPRAKARSANKTSVRIGNWGVSWYDRVRQCDGYNVVEESEKALGSRRPRLKRFERLTRKTEGAILIRDLFGTYGRLQKWWHSARIFIESGNFGNWSKSGPCRAGGLVTRMRRPYK